MTDDREIVRATIFSAYLQHHGQTCLHGGAFSAAIADTEYYMNAIYANNKRDDSATWAKTVSNRVVPKGEY